MFFTFGLVAAFGLVLWLLNLAFYKMVGKGARKICYITGCIGTPVHEIGHAIFCVLFRHKITAIKLYQIGDDGTLGYVNHRYNRRNPYHQIGNFFIGIGPIILGSLVILGLMFMFVPRLFHELGDERGIWRIVYVFFTSATLDDWRFWVFIIPAISIALHMSLSIPDIKGSAGGFGFIAVIWLIVDLIVVCFGMDAMYGFTDGCMNLSYFIVNFLMISIVLTAAMVVITMIIKDIAKLFQRG